MRGLMRLVGLPRKVLREPYADLFDNIYFSLPRHKIQYSMRSLCLLPPSLCKAGEVVGGWDLHGAR